MGDEETLRQQYELEDRWHRRNEGREVYPQAQLDWIAGEVVFDGKRWHVAAAAALVLLTLASLLFALTRPKSAAGKSPLRTAATASTAGAQAAKKKA